ncbi:MAG: YDG domain-containing protein [Planctomycetia bacterium]|nr:YDG domain-containing protein [Planctomycetia bacterium]
MNWRNWLPFSDKKSSRKPIPEQGRRERKKLRLETLEQRCLLSVSVAEMNTLNTLYSELKLEAVDDWNVLEIEARQLTTESLLSAIKLAESSAQNDLIVIRTSDTPCTIQFTETLDISLDSTVSGKLSIVTLGAAPLRVTGDIPTLVEIDSGILQFGGITFIGLHNTAGYAENPVMDGFSSTLISVSETAEVVYDSTLFVTGANTNPTSSLNGTYYSAEFKVSDSSTQWAYLTGLSAEDIVTLETTFTSSETDKQVFTGQFLDAEKEWSNTEDDELCWAASLANMLWYTGWGNEALATDADGNPLFRNEDDLFDYFCDSFTDYGGHTYYGMEWFLTGNYHVQGDSNWSQVKNSENGGFYTGDYKFISIMDLSTANTLAGMSDMTTGLRNASAVSLGVGWYRSTTSTERMGGHALTVWGYVYDTAYSSADAAYYAGLFLTDSDDTQGTDARESVNQLCYIPIRWDSSKNNWYFINHSSYGYLDNFTILTPYTSQVSLSTDSRKAELSTSTLQVGDALTLSDVAITVGDKEQSHVFTVSVYASLDDTISADSDILLGTMTVDSLAKNTTTTLNFSELDTTQLTRNTTYRVGWVLDSILDTDLTDNTALLPETLSVISGQLDGISLTAQSVTYDGTTHLPFITGTHAEDRILYSLDGVHFMTASALNITDVGTYTVWAAVSRDGYQDWKGSTTVTVSPKTLTVTASATDKIYDGTTSATGSVTLNGLISGDSVTLTGGNWTFNSENVGTHSVTYSGYTLTGSDAENYTLSATSVTTSATITPALLDVPEVSASGTSISSMVLNITVVENAAAYHILVTRDAAGTEIVTEKRVETAVPVTFSELNEETEYYFTVTALGTGNYANSATTQTRATTWTRQFNLKIRNSGVIATDCLLPDETLAISGIEITNTGRDMGREYQVSFYAVSAQNPEGDAVLLSTISRAGLEAGAVDVFPEQILDLSMLASGQYLLYWGITAAGVEMDTTDNVTQLLPMLNLLSHATIQITEATQMSENTGTMPENGYGLTEWSTFKLDIHPEWKSESGTGNGAEIESDTESVTSLIRIAYDSRLFTLVEVQTWTAPGVEVTILDYSMNMETGLREVLLLMKKSSETRSEISLKSVTGKESVVVKVTENSQENTTVNVLENVKEERFPAVQLSFIPTAGNSLSAGSSVESWLFCNGVDQSVSVKAFDYDLNEDGKVDILDLVEFAHHFNKNATESVIANASDFNNDGTVDILDLVMFARNFNNATSVNISAPITEHSQE